MDVGSQRREIKEEEDNFDCMAKQEGHNTGNLIQAGGLVQWKHEKGEANQIKSRTPTAPWNNGVRSLWDQDSPRYPLAMCLH